MPTHDFNLSNLQLWTVDGIPLRLCNLGDVQTFDDTDTQCDSVTWSNIRSMDDFTFTIAGVTRKLRNLLAYGWKAKGPVRKRVLMKLRKRKALWEYAERGL